MKLMLQIQEGLINLFSAKLRSLLALLGILVGTASVVAMVCGGQLATNEALRQFKTLGTDLLAISINEASEQNQTVNTQENLSLSQTQKIILSDNKIIKLAPYTQAYNSMVYAGHMINGSILGVTENFAQIIHLKLQAGRFISILDKYSAYCVIGNNLYEEIKKYTLTNPIGQQIQIGKDFFTIIGVASPWPENSFVYASVDSSIMIPILAASTISKYSVINNIIVQLAPHADIDQVKIHISSYINAQVAHKNLFYRSAKELIASMTKQSDILTIFLGFIGGVSLLVGGIGVMNIMLVSVVERRREIGIRLAVGARKKDIQILFLAEAIILSLVGGVMGVLIGMLIAYLIAWFSHWQFTLFLLPPVIGFTVSAATGVFFGFYPAYKASRLDPIEALKSEG